MKNNRVTWMLGFCLGLSAFPAMKSQADSLEFTVAQTLHSHPTVREVFFRYHSYQQEHRIARGGWLPTLDLQAVQQLNKSESPISRLRDDVESGRAGNVSLTLRQMLFDGFYTARDSDRTQAEAQAEFWSLLATTEEVALEVARVYLDVLKTQQLQRLAEQNLQSHRGIFEQIKERVESGLGSQSDLSQIRGRLARAHANYLAAQNNAADAKSSFMAVTGYYPQELRAPVPDIRMIPASKQQLLEQARDQHPILTAASFDVHAVEQLQRQHRAAYWPQLHFEVQANQFNRWQRDNDYVDRTQARLVLRYNLFNGRRDQHQVTRAAYRTAEAKEIRERAWRQVQEGARLSWQAERTLFQQLAYLQEHVEESYKTQTAYREQFDLGRRSLLDLLDTENELFEARGNFVTAEYDHLFANYRILQAKGQLLAALRIDPDDFFNAQGQE
ncbi:MAG: TolC family outer membrane protein [Alkalimonas sp.]|nr:TolC family outer membrane protein [Alkalimonas sp.]